MKILTLLLIGILATGCVAMPPELNITVTQPEGAAVELPALAAMDARGITSSFSEPAVFEHDVSVGGNLDVTGTATIAGATAWGANMVFEGATADAYETTFAITDPTSSDKTITFPNSTGTVALNPYGASIEFEGATADDYEAVLYVTDPTADITHTLPMETGAVMVSSLTTNATDAANSVTGASNGLRFEGATANDFELSVTVADIATPDKTVTLPDATGTVMLSTLATNAPDAANAVTGGTNQLIFEGATGGADAYETVLTPTDPTADRTLTLPNMTGTVLVASAANKVVFGSNTVTGTLAVTHGLTTPAYALCSLGADPVDNEEDRCTVTISSATVTVKVWKEAGSPTAGDSGVTVYWMVAGTP